MTPDSEGAVGHDSRGTEARALRLTTAGRLLRDIAADPRIDLERLASQIGISVRQLHACREGRGPLPIEAQIVLGAIIADLAPEHARRARQLHAQAQSALRVRDGSVESHMTYYWRRPR